MTSRGWWEGDRIKETPEEISDNKKRRFEADVAAKVDLTKCLNTFTLKLDFSVFLYLRKNENLFYSELIEPFEDEAKQPTPWQGLETSSMDFIYAAKFQTQMVFLQSPICGWHIVKSQQN